MAIEAGQIEDESTDAARANRQALREVNAQIESAQKRLEAAIANASQRSPRQDFHIVQCDLQPGIPQILEIEVDASTHWMCARGGAWMWTRELHDWSFSEYCALMVARTYSATLVGVNAVEVEIETHEGYGNGPRFIIVGLPDAAVKESRDRVMAALMSNGFTLHSGITTINIAPADLKKEGPAFELPIAISLVSQTRKLDLERLSETAMAGELALNGELRPVRGLLAIALEARARGRKRLLVPKRAAMEPSVVSGIDHHRRAQSRGRHRLRGG